MKKALILKGGDFTLTAKSGRKDHVRIVPTDGANRLWFVNLVNPDGQEFYLGCIVPANGSIRLTKASKFEENDPALQRVTRTFQKIWKDQYNDVVANGWKFEAGRPDGADATPKPPAEPKPAPKVIPAPPASPPPSLLNMAPNRKRPDIGRCNLLFYYIPMVRREKANGQTALVDLYPNPSATLRRIGIRLDGSVWVVQETRIPWPLVDSMLKAVGPRDERVACHVAPFDKEANEKFIQIAQAYLKDELAEVQKRLLASVQTAQDAYDEAVEGGEGAEKAMTKFQKRVAAAVSSAKRYREDYLSAARNFGVDGDIKDNLAKTGTLVEVLGSLARNRAASYAKALELVKGTELEAAAKTGDVPALVLADKIEENGGDASELRDTFANDDEYELED